MNWGGIMGNSKFEAYNYLHDVVCAIDLETLEVEWVNNYGIKRFGPLKKGIKCHEYFYKLDKPCNDCNKCEFVNNFDYYLNECYYNDTNKDILGSYFKSKKTTAVIDGKKYLISTLYDVDSLVSDFNDNVESKIVYETLIKHISSIELDDDFSEKMRKTLTAVKNMFKAKRVSFLHIEKGVNVAPIVIKDEGVKDFHYNPIMKNIIFEDPYISESINQNRYVEINKEFLKKSYPEVYDALVEEEDYNFSLMTWMIGNIRYYLVIEDYSVILNDKVAYQIIYNYLFFSIRSFLYNKALYNLGNTDMLTGLMNRNKYNVDIASSYNVELKDIGVVFLDLDRLKDINDNFGHKMGDKLIKAISKILIEEFPSASIYRTGGDEFIVINKNIGYEDFNLRILEMGKRIKHGRIYCSYGVIYESDNANLAEMVEKAEHDMYLYKRKHHDYSLEAEQEAFILNFKSKVQKGRYFIALQPKIDPYKHRIVGAEALIRGRGEKGEIEYPNSFIPIFEKNHCIDIIDLFALEETCKFQRKIVDEYGWTIPISVNITRSTLLLDTFENDVLGLLEKYKLDKWMIRLELTERLNASADDILLYGKRLNERGIRLEIDDFGSHFTNLGFLNSDVFSVIKIDRTIVNKLIDDTVTSKVMEVIVKECHNAGIQVLAEGVENILELESVKKLNIDLVQGYYYDRPIIPEEFVTKYIKQY